MSEYAWERGREPSVTDSAITVPSGRHLMRLRAKLQEYRHGVHPLEEASEEIAALESMREVRGFIRRYTLESVIDLAATRDTGRAPIIMPEVALDIEARTGLSVSAAVTIPFLYDSEADWHVPDIASTIATAGEVPGMFAEAYGIVRAYANDRLDMLSGGSLPEIPEG